MRTSEHPLNTRHYLGEEAAKYAKYDAVACRKLMAGDLDSLSNSFYLQAKRQILASVLKREKSTVVVLGTGSTATGRQFYADTHTAHEKTWARLTAEGFEIGEVIKKVPNDYRKIVRWVG